MSARPPLVSVLLAAHDAERFLRTAVESVLRQTVSDLEVIVVDDCSTDSTGGLLDAVEDPRLVRLRNDEQLGLAASLDRGLDAARGRYVARLDADDVALPHRLERQLARMRADAALAVLGSAVLELDETGRPGRLHRMPTGRAEVRWASLFSSPFFHPSVLVERELLEREGLRYDPEYLESEDYDLWTRLLAVGEGDNLGEPLVLYRVHAGQASSARRDLQRDFQRRVALREIAALAPELPPERAELAWHVGAREPLEAHEVDAAVAAFLALVESFERRYGPAVRPAAARSLARISRPTALKLDPALALRTASRRASRAHAGRSARRVAARRLAELELDMGARPLRVTAVFPEPTPYRAPLLDRIAELPGLELSVLYAAQTVAGRTWDVRPRHPAVVLRSRSVPGSARILRHDYALAPGVGRELERTRPDVVVVSGWSTFAAQAALLWCRRHAVPYVLVVESHDEDARPPWRRLIKDAVVPRVVEGASGALVTGTLARRSLVARGAAPDRVHVFANTVDVEAFARRADELGPRCAELRDKLGARPDDVVVLSVGRLVPDKGMDLLVRAVAGAGGNRLVLVLAGEGPERARLERLARELDVRLVLAGDRPWDRISELYAAADVFALLSRREPWGVVVNEAAASGLPLVLSAGVGAAHDLLADGENGFLVEAGDVAAAAEAVGALASDPDLRRRLAARSREIAAGWGYGPSVDGFVAAVREAVARAGD